MEGRCQERFGRLLVVVNGVECCVSAFVTLDGEQPCYTIANCKLRLC